ncbi:transcription factor Pcc1-domain-containing protein [Echria macrotheca]|uniref:Transcription factor Pcc1-domain-containing protein n=1 Tax=Echria macrotheca TaxID=438768 RepID=A0AAJ0F9A2_9PEZI|nr:transcription factor Pcc1-domain-containing protein [Echria macrotheca]
MATDSEFPCSLTLSIPFPDARLASVALRSIAVDKELSPLVQRSFSTTTAADAETESQSQSVLQVEYKAATNRMLRVAVNAFFDSLALVIEVMQELDIDVLEPAEHSLGDNS